VLLAALISPVPGRCAGPRRLVVLAPSAAEIAGELGLAERIVGACAQCDHPRALRRRPDVGSYVTPSVEAVVGLQPDLVLVVPSPGNRDGVRQIERLGVEVLVVRDRTIADLYEAIERIARRCGVAERGAALTARIRQGLRDVRRSVADRPRPTVLLVVGHRPLVVAGAGTLQDELIDVAGGRNVGRALGPNWPTLSLEVLSRETPDVLIDAAMGSEAGLRAVLPATGRGAAPRIVQVPVDQLVRAGPRIVEAARALARELHPGLAE
jgi:ABC-type hemin transport system substrate-binding protein